MAIQPDFTNKQAFPTEAYIQGARRPGKYEGLSNIINSGMSGISKGMELGKEIQEIRQKKERRNMLAQLIESPEVDSTAKNLGVPKQMILDSFETNPAATLGIIQKNIEQEKEITKPTYEEALDMRTKAQEKIQKVKTEQAAQKSFNTYIADASKAMSSLEKVRALTPSIGDFGRNPISQIAGKITTGYKKFSKDEQMTRYIGVVQQEMIPIARNLAEEKGPITEQDVARIEKGLGDLTTPIADKQFLLDQMQFKVQQAILAKAETAGMTINDIAKKYPEMFKRVFSKEIKLEGQQNRGQPQGNNDPMGLFGGK